MCRTSVIIEGRIIRKRKRRDCIVLGITDDDNLLRPVNVIVAYDHPSLAFCFVDAIVRVQTNIQDNDDRIFSDSIDLVQCAPDPSAVQHVLEGVLDGRYPEWTLPVTKTTVHEICGCSDSVDTTVTTPHIISPRQRHEIAKIVRLLKGGDAERDPRQRTPQVKRCDLELLDDVESRTTTLRSIQLHATITQPNDEGSHSNPHPLLHLPLHVDLNRVSRGLTREEYILEKKQPQVQWMTHRLRELRKVPHHVIDVGGGRGDLAMAIAQVFPSTTITVVDKNEPSLLVGQSHANSVGYGNRMSFVHADFHDFTEDPSSYVRADSTPPIDLVVALHACGDLSDLAMAFAIRLSIPFVVCPCCYTKRYIPKFQPVWYNCWTDHEVQVLSRLAELNERPQESRRARRIINSTRLGCLDENEWDIYLEEYESKSSLRNLVLIGDR